MQFYTLVLKLNFFGKIDPQFLTIANFYGRNQIPGTWIPLYKLFQGQLTMLRFSGKSLFRPQI